MRIRIVGEGIGNSRVFVETAMTETLTKQDREAEEEFTYKLDLKNLADVTQMNSPTAVGNLRACRKTI
ncbi:hypothetical protein L6452_23851 [Arctium lappa]|uniref:Uncharacterized protein n=1 Tax=Arctium lappa TaxID=4217 RepID=A0ACB9A9M9_ARCLA|nr:hypothetical protein L6452_23851 [Arctium lappa]